MKRKVILISSLILIVSIMLVNADTAGLNNQTNIRFSTIDDFRHDFYISSYGKCTISSDLFAVGCKAKISVYLQEYKSAHWTTLKHWTTPKELNHCAFFKNWYVEKGNKYRIKSYGYTYKNGRLSESTSYTSDAINY